MKLKATDQLHVSNVKPDPIRPGEEFEITDAEGKQLVARGLATQVKKERKMSSPKSESKAAPKPANKAAPAPSNKAAAASGNK